MSQEGPRTEEANESDPHRLFTDLIFRAVRGENMFAHARVPEAVPPDVASFLERALASLLRNLQDVRATEVRVTK